MHFHLPKPLHGWRAFAGEVGIIVIGVLIALGAEQVVEDWRERAQVRETEDAIRVELRDDDLPQAYARAAVHDCFAAELEAIENAVTSGRDRNEVLAQARSYAPAFRTWDDEAWKAALASQPFVETGARRMIGWSSAYWVMPVLSQQASDEQAQLAQLRVKLSGAGPLSAAQQDRLLQVTAMLRNDNARITGGVIVLMNRVNHLGLTLTAKEKANIIGEAREKYGACARPPSVQSIDFSRQFTTTRPSD